MMLNNAELKTVLGAMRCAAQEGGSVIVDAPRVNEVCDAVDRLLENKGSGPDEEEVRRELSKEEKLEVLKGLGFEVGVIVPV